MLPNWKYVELFWSRSLLVSSHWSPNYIITLDVLYIRIYLIVGQLGDASPKRIPEIPEAISENMEMLHTHPWLPWLVQNTFRKPFEAPLNCQHQGNPKKKWYYLWLSLATSKIIPEIQQFWIGSITTTWVSSVALLADGSARWHLRTTIWQWQVHHGCIYNE